MLLCPAEPWRVRDITVECSRVIGKPEGCMDGDLKERQDRSPQVDVSPVTDVALDELKSPVLSHPHSPAQLATPPPALIAPSDH